MENKINISELLKDCPKGMELDCPMFEGIELDYVGNDNSLYPIHCRVKTGQDEYSTENFTKYGCFTTDEYAKCVIFPKGKRTWEGFQRPFKDGDIIVKGRYIVIVWYIKSNGVIYYHGCYDIKYADVKIMKDCGIGTICDNCVVRLATEEEKQRLFDAFKKIGVKWNTDKKMLEKIVEVRFKVGNIIQDADGYKVKITGVYPKVEAYTYESVIAKGVGSINFKEQDNWKLVPTVIIKKENKELLLKDLCARLPYGVKFACNKNVYTAKGIDLIVTDEGDWEYAVTAKGIAPIEIDIIKPYLRPLSSMTEKEELEYKKTQWMYQADYCAPEYFDGIESYDWFDKHHFDYRGLIEKGLAIKAPEGMYN